MKVGSLSVYIDDLHVTEEEKQSEDYLKSSTDFWIANLVRHRPKYKTYRNYYNGVRDAEAFTHITDNYGVGTPSSLTFTPIIKPRIDSLLSQLEIETFNYSVSCTDSGTIDKIRDDKEKSRLSDIRKAVDAYAGVANTTAEQLKKADTILGKEIETINRKYGGDFVDDFVSAAINVLQYFESNYHADVRQKLKQMLLDLLITGECYYRVYSERIGSDPVFEVYKPENMFFNKNTNSQYLDTSDAVVHREYLTRKQILRKYGKFMDESQKDYLFGEGTSMPSTRSIPHGKYVDLRYYPDDTTGQKSYTLTDTIEVFHVEWLALNPVEDQESEDLETTVDGYSAEVNPKKMYRMDRYEAVRIGGSIYVNAGKSRYVSRTQDNPFECGFSYDGVMYSDRNGEPYSLVGAMKDLQDAYDLIIFHRDNLVANSGVSGDRINLAAIPKILGNDFMERLMVFSALKKNGMEVYNPTEPGAQMFQHYGSYDNSVSGNSLAAIKDILATIEYQADIIAGTNQQMLGQIAERDAVSNVKMGIQRSLMRNQDLFESFRNIHNRMLNRYIMQAQVAYKEGKKGSYVAGPKTYVFEILPENFCYSDFAITINYSSKDEMKVQRLQALAQEFAKSNTVDPITLTEAVLSESASEIMKLLKNGYEKVKAENSELQQYKQQVEQLSEQVKQAGKELVNLQAQIEKYKAQGLDIKKKEVEIKEKVAEYNKKIKELENATLQEHYRNQDMAKQEAVKLEREQLYLETGPAKEINNEI